MIYIAVNEQTNQVEFIHNMPFDEKWGMGKTEEELLETGHLVSEIPTADVIEGKTPILKYDGDTLYYEYENIVQEPSELDLLAQKLETQEQAITELSIYIATLGI